MAIILFEKLTSPIPSSFEEKNNIKKWRMKCLLSILFLYFQFNFSFAQPSQIKRTWHWYFGNQAGIDFSSGTAVADTNGALNTSEGCASISDTAGNLQFYSDGRTIWNRNHLVMPNGTGIMGGATGSSTQQALIIPKPLSSSIYYLFTTDESPGNNGFRFTVINMNLDGGMGDVDISQKNILLFAPCAEKLAAVNHCNDTSVWVLGHEVNNNHFRAYLVTGNGIDTNAVVSAVGHPNMTNFLGGLNGPIKFSPNGLKLCSVTDTSARRVELFDFDINTGLVSNGFTLSTNSNFNYAVSFSSGSSKLYIGSLLHNLHQYNLLVNDSSAIRASKTLIADMSSSGNGFRYLTEGPDDKIYVAHSFIFDSLISVIEQPDSSGIVCNLNLFSINLINSGTRSGLPNFNESYFRKTNANICITGFAEIENDNVLIFPNPARDWISVRGSAIKEISVFDVLGNFCYKAAGDFTSPQRINVSNLTDGIYFIDIKSAKTNIIKKFIKQ